MSLPYLLSLPHNAYCCLRVFRAQVRDYILPYIISPAAVYGPGRDPARKTPVGPHLLVQLTMKHGGFPVVNAGTAVWANVHIHDVTHLYVQVFRQALQDSVDTIDVQRPSDAGLPISALKRHFAVGHMMTWVGRARTITRALIFHTRCSVWGDTAGPNEATLARIEDFRRSTLIPLLLPTVHISPITDSLGTDNSIELPWHSQSGYPAHTQLHLLVHNYPQRPVSQHRQGRTL